MPPGSDPVSAPGFKIKVRLESGRILGPLDLDRVRRLILKNHVLGHEQAKVLPDGAWMEIIQIEPVARLFLMRAEGRLAKDGPLPMDELLSAQVGSRNDPAFFQNISTLGPTKILTSAGEPEKTIPDPPAPPTAAKPPTPEERTEAFTAVTPPDDATEVNLQSELSVSDLAVEPAVENDTEIRARALAHEPTQIVLRSDLRGNSNQTPEAGKPKTLFNIPKEKLRTFALSLLIGYLFYELTESDFSPKKAAPTLNQPGVQALSTLTGGKPFRPVLPRMNAVKPDPAKSNEKYRLGLNYYILDHVEGYRKAAEFFIQAIGLDSGNVQALALLASTYLNLIDSSNKDESYFQVITNLIELSRARSVDLQETVVADVELYLNTNRFEAAQNRIIDYKKAHPGFAFDMFFYLAQTLYARGDFVMATRYLGQIPENKIVSAKTFHLRGLLAEKLQEIETAEREYLKAIAINPDHSRSRVRLAYVMNLQGRLKEAGPHLEYVLKRPQLLSPKDLAHAYFLAAKYEELNRKGRLAFDFLEKAVQLDNQNHDYWLEYFTLKAKSAENSPGLKKEARMFLLLSDGERQVALGKYQDALIQFLQARHMNDKSPVPLVKIGDMFRMMGDVANAKINYKMAADRAPSDIDIWSKYIDSLIQAFEWDEAQKAMEKFRNLPVKQSAIDKAAADLYQKQGRYQEAQSFYRKAMARDSIDSTVYIAYAKSLMSTERYQEAPFFFALGLRFDPLNLDAVIGTAKCIAATDSIDRAISYLQDEIQKRAGVRGELLTAIAELQMQKGNHEVARSLVEQALTTNPDFPGPYRVLGQLYAAQLDKEKLAIDKALDAYKSYSDRNPSDPSGYLERFKLLVRKADFEKASEELGKIYGVFPKYPKLHYYKGMLYTVQGNQKLAVEEFQEELRNNPFDTTTLIQLGKSYIEAGRNSEALSIFKKAMSVSPQSSDARQLAGYANYLLRNYDGAVALYQSALPLDPGNPMIYKRLAVALKAVGNHRGAAEAAKRYLQMEPDAVDRAEFEALR